MVIYFYSLLALSSADDLYIYSLDPESEVIKFFSCSTQLSIICIMVANNCLHFIIH